MISKKGVTGRSKEFYHRMHHMFSISSDTLSIPIINLHILGKLWKSIKTWNKYTQIKEIVTELTKTFSEIYKNRYKFYVSNSSLSTQVDDNNQNLFKILLITKKKS